MLSRRIVMGFAAVAALPLAGCSDSNVATPATSSAPPASTPPASPPPASPPPAAPPPSGVGGVVVGGVVDTLRGETRFSILVEAIEAAGLATALSGTGPFTIFAPTNDAFAALLTELGTTKDALFGDTATLAAVLSYHVLDSRVPASAIQLGKAVKPLAGGWFKLEIAASGIGFKDGANRVGGVTQTDIAAVNGVIHVLDRVMLPATQNMVTFLSSLPDFSLLVEALGVAGLGTALSAAGPLTLFAPNNAAFSALLSELGVTKEQLFADTATLTAVLTYHVVPSLAMAADLTPGGSVTTLETGTFTVTSAPGIVDERGRTATIVTTDVFVSNGVVHKIDRVILPSAN